MITEAKLYRTYWIFKINSISLASLTIHSTWTHLNESMAAQTCWHVHTQLDPQDRISLSVLSFLLSPSQDGKCSAYAICIAPECFPTAKIRLGYQISNSGERKFILVDTVSTHLKTLISSAPSSCSWILLPSVKTVLRAGRQVTLKIWQPEFERQNPHKICMWWCIAVISVLLWQDGRQTWKMPESSGSNQWEIHSITA